MSFKAKLRRLYLGSDDTARRFRLGLLFFDVIVLAVFVVGSFYTDALWERVVDVIIAILLAIDLTARYWIDDRAPRFFRQPSTWLDILVIVTLVLPFLVENALFLRVLRAIRLFHSYHVLRDLRREFSLFRRNEQVIDASVNLMVFVFITSAIVYVAQVRTNPGINNYVDALYFTVTTLTTTGFGDIVMKDTFGRMLAVGIMIIGFGLFLQLVQAIFRPRMRQYDCPDCGLKRHEFDAIHCKHCGRVLKIPSEGEGVER